MKAMTLWQPWASLMAEGIKTIETRPFPHPWRSAVGERVAIHAGLVFASVCPDGGTCHHRCTPSRGPERSGCYRVDCCGPLSGTIGQGPDEDYWPEFPRGAVLATARLVDVVPMIGKWGDETGDLYYPVVTTWTDIVDGKTPRARLRRSPLPDDCADLTDQIPYGNFEPGRWALLFDDLVKLEEPVPARGRQGLWNWNQEAA